MIIVQTAKKDTFVTDMSTSYYKGSEANFGQASTLDLFKIVGENKNVKSRSLLTITEPINDATFTISDYAERSVTFIIKNDSNIVDGSLDANGNVIIGILDANNQSSIAERFISAINNVSSFLNGLTLDISAYKLDVNKVLLQQNKTGVSGDTIPVISNNPGFTITNFRRFEHSAVLLTYDLQEIYNKHIVSLNNSIFSSQDGENFIKDFKAYLKLSDVGIDSTSSKNFTLRVRALNNDFNEGIGKDILQFSDLGDANFITINSQVSPNINWTLEGSVLLDDIYFNNTFESKFTVSKGNEDIYFDITDHVYEFLQTARDNDGIGSLTQTFVIDFLHDNLFDEYTYFIKRLGSRNLSNKYKRPKLEIKIKDSKFENINYDNKKRFLDNNEVFYITNLINKKMIDWPVGSSQRLDISYLDESIVNTNLTFLRVPDNNTYISIYDSNDTVTYGFIFGGGAVPGADFVIDTSTNVDGVDVSKSINQVLIDFENEIATRQPNTISTILNSNSIDISLTNTVLIQNSFVNIFNDTRSSIISKETKENINLFSSAINPDSVYDYKGSTLTGIKKFVLNENTISRFNLSKKFQNDLSNNKKVSIDFKYYLVKDENDFLIKSEKVDFYLPETSEVDMFKKLRVVLDTQQKTITADDSIKLLKFSFIDISSQYKVVNTPLDTISEDIGDVQFKMYNIDTGQILLDNDKSFDDTLLLFNGKHYIANLFASSIYKNLRVGFEFEYVDPLTGLYKKIKNEKNIVRFE